MLFYSIFLQGLRIMSFLNCCMLVKLELYFVVGVNITYSFGIFKNLLSKKKEMSQHTDLKK